MKGTEKEKLEFEDTWNFNQIYFCYKSQVFCDVCWKLKKQGGFEMKGVEVTTNMIPRDLIYWDDLTEKEKLEFEDAWNFNQIYFRYKGQVFCIGDAMHIEDYFWHGYIGLTAFSALYVHITKDCDQIIIGYATS